MLLFGAVCKLFKVNNATHFVLIYKDYMNCQAFENWNLKDKSVFFINTTRPLDKIA